jgi:hypothetical protein
MTLVHTPPHAHQAALHKTSTHENGKNKKIKLLKKGELQPEFNGFDIFTASKGLLRPCLDTQIHS